MIQINEKALKDFKEKTKELDSFLTERISAFQGVKEMIQARRDYFFYRQMLWDVREIINNGIKIVETKTEMRKFKFVGDPSDYGNRKGLIFGKTYDENYKPYPTKDILLGRIFIGKKYTEKKDWQEVFDNDTIVTNHKDTDLGYYAGLLLSSGKYIPKDCIDLAKELIKKLNEEKK